MRKPPGSLDAWAAYQRGLWHLSKFGPDHFALARQFFQKAIGLDPNFAGGYTGLAYARNRAAARRGRSESTSAELARRAVALDANDAEARVCLGFMMLWQGDYEGAFAESEAALALSPNLASAHGLVGSVLNWSNRHEEGRVALERSIRLDPRDPNLATRFLALTVSFYLSGEYGAAIEAAKRTIRSYPDRENAYRWLAAALGQAGRIEEAKEALEKAIAIAPASFNRHVQTRVPWHRPEHHAHMVEGQGDAQGQVLLLEDPVNPGNSPIYGVLTKRLIDNIRVSRSRIRSKVRAVPKTPHFDVKNEADGDLLFSRPCSYMNGFSR